MNSFRELEMRTALTPYIASLLVGGLTAWAFATFVVTDYDELHGTNDDVYITIDQFLALVGLVVGAPATLVLYVVAMSAVTSSAELSRGAKLAFHTLHVVLLAALLVLFWIVGGSDLLGCGLFFCVGPVTRKQIETQPFSSGIATTSALALFLATLVVLVGQAAIALRLWCRADGAIASGTSPAAELEAVAEEAAAPPRRPRIGCGPAWAWSVAWFALGLPATWLLTMYAPNSWENFTAVNMRVWASVGINNADNASACAMEFSGYEGSLTTSIATSGWSYPCPEYAGASLHTVSWRLSSHVALKFFPDVWIFYAMIYAATLFGVVATHVPACRAAMRRRPAWLALPAVPRLLPHGYNLLVGQVVFASILAVPLLAICAYWFFDHDWHNKAAQGTYWSSSNKAARTLGQLGSMLLGLLALPVARNSVWLGLFGVSWESAISLHQILGRLFVAVVVAHMLCWWVTYAQDGGFPVDLWRVGYNSESADNFTIALTTYSSYVMFVVFGVFTLEFVRRRHFELFYYTHAYALVVYVVALWHATSAWYFVAPSIALYAVDRALRVWSGTQETALVGCVAHPGGVTELTFERYDFAPGQYAFLNVPEISTLQWHPFTISSAPSDAHVTHHIRAMGSLSGDGPRSFTAQLHALAASRSSPDDALAVRVDGPYGHPPAYASYDDVLFVAGGIGVTPCHASVRELYLRAREAAEGKGGGVEQAVPKGRAGGGYGSLDSTPSRVRLVWAVRERRLASLFAGTLQMVAADDARGRFSASLYLTRPETEEMEAAPGLASTLGLGKRRAPADGTEGLSFRSGRPDIAAELAALSEMRGLEGERATRRTLIFVCGPKELAAECDAAAMRAGVDFHAETFEL